MQPASCHREPLPPREGFASRPPAPYSSTSGSPASLRYQPRQLEYAKVGLAPIARSERSASSASSTSLASSVSVGQRGPYWYNPRSLETHTPAHPEEDSEQYRNRLKAESARILQLQPIGASSVLNVGHRLSVSSVSSLSPPNSVSSGQGRPAVTGSPLAQSTVMEKSFDSADAEWYSERARAQRMQQQQQQQQHQQYHQPYDPR